MYSGITQGEKIHQALHHTSDRVQMIPTWFSLAFRASSKTLITPASVEARPMLQTANISWHSRKYLSVVTRLAEFKSRRPGRMQKLTVS